MQIQEGRAPDTVHGAGGDATSLAGASSQPKHVIPWADSADESSIHHVSSPARVLGVCGNARDSLWFHALLVARGRYSDRRSLSRRYPQLPNRSGRPQLVGEQGMASGSTRRHDEIASPSSSDAENCVPESARTILCLLIGLDFATPPSREEEAAMTPKVPCGPPAPSTGSLSASRSGPLHGGTDSHSNSCARVSSSPGSSSGRRTLASTRLAIGAG
jgi:hypothetical protein